ncbi:hypothetical protein TNCV_1789541 [Trichonephila clavipes]|nr:hypothetical protein TNCV_1789541 [Trichonephila clavipes]
MTKEISKPSPIIRANCTESLKKSIGPRIILYEMNCAHVFHKRCLLNGAVSIRTNAHTKELTMQMKNPSPIIRAKCFYRWTKSIGPCRILYEKNCEYVCHKGFLLNHALRLKDKCQYQKTNEANKKGNCSYYLDKSIGSRRTLNERNCGHFFHNSCRLTHGARIRGK